MKLIDVKNCVKFISFGRLCSTTNHILEPGISLFHSVITFVVIIITIIIGASVFSYLIVIFTISIVNISVTTITSTSYSAGSIILNRFLYSLRPVFVF